jgi:hypothetical protein
MNRPYISLLPSAANVVHTIMLFIIHTALSVPFIMDRILIPGWCEVKWLHCIIGNSCECSVCKLLYYIHLDEPFQMEYNMYRICTWSGTEKSQPPKFFSPIEGIVVLECLLQRTSTMTNMVTMIVYFNSLFIYVLTQQPKPTYRTSTSKRRKQNKGKTRKLILFRQKYKFSKSSQAVHYAARKKYVYTFIFNEIDTSIIKKSSL